MANAAISASSSGDNTIITGVSNRVIEVLQYTFTVSDNCTVTWKSGSTPISGALSITAAGGIVSSSAPVQGGELYPILKCAQNESLVANLSAAVTMAGHVTYRLKGV